MIPEVEKLTVRFGKDLLTRFEKVYGWLVDKHETKPHVKTIYVGFSIGRDIVAAIYPRGDVEFEMALALPEDHDSEVTYPAGHLKWRTLPVAVMIDGKTDVRKIQPLIKEAVGRISSGEHGVRLSDDKFPTASQWNQGSSLPKKDRSRSR